MVFYNEDWIHFYWTRYSGNVPITEESLKEYIYSFKDTQITDFAMNINGTVSATPSKILETFMDKYLAEEENGVKVDFKNTFAKWAYDVYEVKKLNMHNIWVKTLKEIGINPWLSFRTNDCHDSLSPIPTVRKSSQVEKGKGKYISSHRDPMDYFDKSFDYADSDVRCTVLAYLEEQLEAYDVYGLELDMTREFIFFRPGLEEQGRKIMTDFINEVFVLLKKIGKKRGHEMKLSLVVHPNPDDCWDRGIDLLSFAEKVDLITIIGRWDSTDTDMPIELWKQLLRGFDIKLGGGQQLLISAYRKGDSSTISSLKMAFGQAAANLSRGCDFVYLYNYMDKSCWEGGLGDWTYKTSIRNDDVRSLMFNNIGSLDTLMKQERSHTISYHDFNAFPRNEHYVMPVEFGENPYHYEMLKIPVGQVPTEKKVRLILGIDKENLRNEDFSIFVNTKRAQLSGQIELDPHIYGKTCYTFDLSDHFFNIFVVELLVKKPCSVEYAEIEIY